MQEDDEILTEILAAFENVAYPGDDCLRCSDDGDEPFLLEQEFRGKTNWRILDPQFLDQAPAGHASALSFFSNGAFRFYLPAYLLSDIRGQLKRTDPVFYLTHSLDESSKTERVNPLRYGEQTWFEHATQRFSVFNREEASAIVTYLRFRDEMDEFGCNHLRINSALKNYWTAR